MSAADRLIYLNKSMYENVSNYIRLDYARLLYEESLLQKNDSTEAEAVFMLAKHFYMINNDSMRYWIGKAVPLYRRIGRFEDLCRMKAWDIYTITSEGKKKEALRAIEDLKALSRELPFPEGMEMADMALANFYFSQNMPADAEEISLDVLHRMEERDAPAIKRYNVIRQLFTNVQDSVRFVYLEKAEDLLRDCKERGMTHLDAESPIFALEYTLHRYYIRGNILKKNAEEAWKHFQIVERIAEENNITHSYMMNFHYMNYYKLTGDYKKALGYADLLEETFRERRNQISGLNVTLKDKAFFLDTLGRSREAYLVMEEVHSLQDTLSRNDFDKTLAEMRTKHEVEKLEIESRQMEAKEQHDLLLLPFLYAGALLLLVVLIVLVYMAYDSHKKRKGIKAAKEKAEEIDLLKTAFLSRINNEIRNPLNVIVGFSDLLIDEEEPAIRLQYAKIIEDSNDSLQQLIANVLDVSKIESGSMTLFLSEQDIPAVLTDIYMEIKPLLPENVDLIPDAFPALKMQIDRNRLPQIIRILLRNAIKFTKQGSIRFGYAIEKEQVRFYVEDTGTGVTEDLQEILFDRFARIVRGEGKTGLGLAIAQGLVKLMGGEIWVESVPGKGSSFFFTIPFPVGENM
jgi:signal transduction histidine kinase